MEPVSGDGKKVSNRFECYTILPRVAVPRVRRDWTQLRPEEGMCLHPAWTYFVRFIIAFAIVYISVPYIRKLAIRLHFVDQPGGADP